MRTDDRVIAVLCSDVHWSIKRPACWSDEVDWFGAMEYYWQQVSDLANKHGVPIIIAGDVFDRWNSPPELLNFAIRMLRGLDVHAIPGQHDMPMHSFEEMHRSAYETLTASEVINNISPGVPFPVLEGWLVWGYPWGVPLIAPKRAQAAGRKQMAIVHHYVWKKGKGYVGADKADHVLKLKKFLAEFDVVVVGDNHKGFLCKVGNTTVLNCGGLMRRSSDELNRKLFVSLLHKSGKVVRKPLQTTIDRYETSSRAAEKENMDLSKFIEALDKMGEMPLNFEAAVKRYLKHKSPPKEVRRIILESLEQ